MPFTPEQLRKNSKQLYESKLKRAIQEIDTILQRSYAGSHPVSIRIDVNDHNREWYSDPQLFTLIKSTYEEYGWTVEKESGGDMREWYSYLHFKETK